MSVGQVFQILAVVLLSQLLVVRDLQANNDSDEVSLIKAGEEFHYIVRTVQLPTHRYTMIALHDLDSKEESERPTPLSNEKAPAQWPQQALVRNAENVQVGAAPMESRGKRACRTCKTVVGDTRKERIAALYLSREFSLPARTNLNEFSSIVLDLKYRDAAIITLNGHRLVTRNIAVSEKKGDVVVARLRRGPEWESFLIPLSSQFLHEGKNFITAEIRPARSRDGVVFDMALALRKTGRVVRGPILQEVVSPGALLVFDTDVPMRVNVEYGDNEFFGLSSKSAAGSLARHHRVRLHSLKEGQTVHYRIVIEGKNLPASFFHMPPGKHKPLRFAVYGDTRGGHTVHQKIITSLQEEAIDFVLATGDLVMRGSDEGDWQRFFQLASPLLARIPYYSVVGNHDIGQAGDEKREMGEIFSLWPRPISGEDTGDWHSFDLAGVHFVMLDSNQYHNQAQLKWLLNDLQSKNATTSRAIIATVHAGPYSRGLHLGHRYAAEHYAPILRKYGVNILFSGHDHLYQRGEMHGLHYVVSGGGGAPLYSVRCGVPGKKKCKSPDGMQAVAREHHYLLVTIYPRHIEMCAKRPDRSPLEPCVRYPLR